MRRRQQAPDIVSRPISLFPDQEKHVNKQMRILDNYAFSRDPSGTGSGKTVTSLWIARSLYQQKRITEVICIGMAASTEKWNLEYNTYEDDGLPPFSYISYASFASDVERDMSRFVERRFSEDGFTSTYVVTERFMHSVREGVLIIVDEAQQIKNENADRSKTLSVLLSMIAQMQLEYNSNPEAEAVLSRFILLTATHLTDVSQGISLMRLTGTITRKKVFSKRTNSDGSSTYIEGYFEEGLRNILIQFMIDPQEDPPDEEEAMLEYLDRQEDIIKDKFASCFEDYEVDISSINPADWRVIADERDSVLEKTILYNCFSEVAFARTSHAMSSPPQQVFRGYFALDHTDDPYDPAYGRSPLLVTGPLTEAYKQAGKNMLTRLLLNDAKEALTSALGGMKSKADRAEKAVVISNAIDAYKNNLMDDSTRPLDERHAGWRTMYDVLHEAETAFDLLLNGVGQFAALKKRAAVALSALGSKGAEQSHIVERGEGKGLAAMTYGTSQMHDCCVERLVSLTIQYLRTPPGDIVGATSNTRGHKVAHCFKFKKQLVEFCVELRAAGYRGEFAVVADRPSPKDSDLIEKWNNVIGTRPRKLEDERRKWVADSDKCRVLVFTLEKGGTSIDYDDRTGVWPIVAFSQLTFETAGLAQMVGRFFRKLMLTAAIVYIFIGITPGVNAVEMMTNRSQKTSSIMKLSMDPSKQLLDTPGFYPRFIEGIGYIDDWHEDYRPYIIAGKSIQYSTLDIIDDFHNGRPVHLLEGSRLPTSKLPTSFTSAVRVSPVCVV